MSTDQLIKNESDIASARNKLDSVLQALIEKADENSGSEEEKELLSPEIEIVDYSSISSPKKGGGFIKSRKRKRKDDDLPQNETGNSHHTYVIKMFDRSVDLAQFTDSTPLYPICRAWMKNDPRNQLNTTRQSRSPSPDRDSFSMGEDSKDEKKFRQVHYLPPPDPIPLVDGKRKDLRIPEPLPPQKDDISLDVYIHDETAAPQKDVMLLNHVNRWKEVRSQWKAAALGNEARFSSSAAILKSLFDQ